MPQGPCAVPYSRVHLDGVLSGPHPVDWAPSRDRQRHCAQGWTQGQKHRHSGRTREAFPSCDPDTWRTAPRTCCGGWGLPVAGTRGVALMPCTVLAVPPRRCIVGWQPLRGCALLQVTRTSRADSSRQVEGRGGGDSAHTAPGGSGGRLPDAGHRPLGRDTALSRARAAAATRAPAACCHTHRQHGQESNPI